MSDQGETFAAAAETLFADQITAFAAWCSEHWKTDPEKDPDAGLTPEQGEGWNLCCDSIQDALKIWLDEMTP